MRPTESGALGMSFNQGADLQPATRNNIHASPRNFYQQDSTPNLGCSPWLPK